MNVYVAVWIHQKIIQDSQYWEEKVSKHYLSGWAASAWDWQVCLESVDSTNVAYNLKLDSLLLIHYCIGEQMTEHSAFDPSDFQL